MKTLCRTASSFSYSLFSTTTFRFSQAIDSCGAVAFVLQRRFSIFKQPFDTYRIHYRSKILSRERSNSYFYFASLIEGCS